MKNNLINYILTNNNKNKNNDKPLDNPFDIDHFGESGCRRQDLDWEKKYIIHQMATKGILYSTLLPSRSCLSFAALIKQL